MDLTTELASVNAKHQALSALRPGLATGKWECPGARLKTAPTHVLNQNSPDAAVGAVTKKGSTTTHARNSGTSQPFPIGRTTTGLPMACRRSMRC